MTQFNEPEMIIIRTIETYRFNRLRDGLLWSINSVSLFGYDKGRFLCISISVNKTDDPELFKVEYLFSYQSETWLGSQHSYKEKNYLEQIDPLKGSVAHVEIIYKQ